MKRKLLIYAYFFALIVIFDYAAYRLTGKTGIIDWRSFIHPAWVITTLILLTITTFAMRPLLWRVAFLIHFAIFSVSLFNQFVPFTQVLSYNCMLFNLTFTSLYYVLTE